MNVKLIYIVNVEESFLLNYCIFVIGKLLLIKFSCKKVICNLCVIEEIEYCYCKNSCKKNKCVSVNQAKKNKNRCDQCLECPNCKTGLVKRVVDDKHFYSCTYCLWDTTNVKLVSKNESDIEGIIYQLKEASIKGFLRKNYDLISNNIKSLDEVNYEGNFIFDLRKSFKVI